MPSELWRVPYHHDQHHYHHNNYHHKGLWHKYGTEVQGFEINQLTKDFLTPIVENLKVDYKIHIATDKPYYGWFDLGIKDINFIKLSEDMIDTHEHWSKIFFFNPYYINAGQNDTTVIMDIDMQWQNGLSRQK